MIIAIDVHYESERAKAAAIFFEKWSDETAKYSATLSTKISSTYIPGEFYKRELPCILELLDQVDLDPIKCIIIDGYVHLNDNGKLGLGGHLFKALNGMIPVIGVAKRSFKSNKKYVHEILRGNSTKPLYISSKGIDLKAAANNITSMTGNYRIPDLLKAVDKLSRSNE